jgi:RNA-binding protein NOB1
MSEDLKDASLEDKPHESEDQAGEILGAADEAQFEDGNHLDGEPLDVDSASPHPESEPPMESLDISEAPLYDDPSDEDDGDGEWITPSNVALHKSRALDLLPSADASRRGKGKQDEDVAAGCMTADFAMQNVLLQMGLTLVGVEGKRIQKVKTWVLRCHACFK